MKNWVFYEFFGDPSNMSIENEKEIRKNVVYVR